MNNDIDIQNKGKHGLLSLMSIIIGTVIGSGIYVKNASLMETSQSSILVMLGWVIGGLLVISILISFFEINSITKKNNTEGTLSNYAGFLFSPKVSRMIGMYFLVVYFPYIVASKAIYSSSNIYSNIDSLQSLTPGLS